MGRGRQRSTERHRRFEDVAGERPLDATSFFFDLKLILPDGMTQSDVHRARQAVERRLQRTVRKKDRIMWTADGFFLLVATTDPARAGAAAERVHADVCEHLAQAKLAPLPKARPAMAEQTHRPPPVHGDYIHPPVWR
jgi:hypothetical protein